MPEKMRTGGQGSCRYFGGRSQTSRNQAAAAPVYGDGGSIGGSDETRIRTAPRPPAARRRFRSPGQVQLGPRLRPLGLRQGDLRRRQRARRGGGGVLRWSRR